ncbi:alpha/beta hydrolase [Sandaracinobacter neustonicus]|uniref:Alpha/beta hydrolase n=1 Tax=Sandaracinobacter neustonicus TaxID=1715348 RepID=A0A501XTA6_9SPHN|nr:alpha/beta hydrolase [Sandaracinobacter neustonicus]TPE63317.1 alpha/beta hydrolase [Sandaracinobacter neustonicus]
MTETALPDGQPKKKRSRIWRWLGFVALLGLLITILMAFHNPPMRLMPVPAAFAKSGSQLFQANPNLRHDNRIELFYATNRLPLGPRNDRIHSITPGRDLLLGVTTIRIGDQGTTWDRVYEWSMGEDGERRPQLILEQMRELASLPGDEAVPPAGPVLDPSMRAWLGLVDEALGRSLDPDIIIYVHGANSTVERAAGQAAQLRHFTGQNAVVLLFAWPTAENFLVYPRDIGTAFGAAPQFARLVELLATHTRARKIDVLSYSAGGTVASDGLARVGSWSRATGLNPKLGQVHHAAPDADLRGFVGDLRDYAGLPDRVTVSLNMEDSALRLSEVMNRGSRAGRPDLRELSPGDLRFLQQANKELGLEIVRVRPGDLHGVSARSHAFWYMDPWAASDVLLQLMFGKGAQARGLAAGPGASGLSYWVFPPDYEARLPGVIERASVGMAEAAIGQKGEHLGDAVRVEGQHAVGDMDDDMIGHAVDPGGRN